MPQLCKEGLEAVEIRPKHLGHGLYLASIYSVGARLPGETGDPGNRRLLLQKARAQPSPTSVCQQTQANQKGYHWLWGEIRASKTSNNE